MNFDKIREGLDVKPLLAALEANEWLFHVITARQKYPGTAHAETETAYMRWSRQWTPEAIFGTLDAVNYPWLLEEIWPLVEAVREFGQAKDIGRVIITRMPPGAFIRPHCDEGVYAQHFRRFHIPLQSGHGCTFACDGETVQMLPGELWWFDHHKEHSVLNASDVDRIHLIVDAA